MQETKETEDKKSIESKIGRCRGYLNDFGGCKTRPKRMLRPIFRGEGE
jgi:hypothetical protein